MKLLLALASAALLLAACGNEKAAVPPRPSATPTLAGSASGDSHDVTDMVGRTIHVPGTVQNVVAISPAAVDFATALGLTVIARSSDATQSHAPAVGSSISPDFAAMANLHPDLVIADAAYQSGRTRDFDSFPYPVFVLKVNSYDDVLAAYTALGDATGHQQQATDAATALKMRVDAAVEKATEAPAHPSVIIVTGAGRDVYGGGDQSYAGGLVKLLAATNALGALPAGAPIAGFGTVDLGQLATKNPDVVLAIPAAGSTLANDVRTAPAWAGTNAVKNGRVYELDPALFLKAPGPRIGDAIEKLYSVLYP